MRGSAIVILAALLAAFGAACMGDDEDEQSRRPAVIGPNEPSPGDEPTLSLTVDGGSPKGLVPGKVVEESVVGGSRHPEGRGFECVAAASPGRTCQWQYVLTATQNTIVRLRARPNAGAGFYWNGCPHLESPDVCRVTFTGDMSVSVRASFPPSVPKLSLTVVSGTNANGSVQQGKIGNGSRTGGSPGVDCISAASPGQTCTWEYARQCPYDPYCIVSLDLVARPVAGARVSWIGCSTVTSTNYCGVNLPASVKANFFIPN